MAGKIIDLASQITIGSTIMDVKNYFEPWSPEVYTFHCPRQRFSRFLYLFTDTGGRQTDLSWCNVDTLRTSVAVTGKDLQEFHEWIPCLLNTSPGDFIETDKKLYLQLKMRNRNTGQTIVDTDSDEYD